MMAFCCEQLNFCLRAAAKLSGRKPSRLVLTLLCGAGLGFKRCWRIFGGSVCAAQRTCHQERLSRFEPQYLGTSISLIEVGKWIYRIVMGGLLAHMLPEASHPILKVVL